MCLDCSTDYLCLLLYTPKLTYLHYTHLPDTFLSVDGEGADCGDWLPVPYLRGEPPRQGQLEPALPAGECTIMHCTVL